MLGRTEGDRERRGLEHRAALLRFIELADRHIADAARMLASGVADARHAGASWEDIGRALGVSAEVARGRFDDVA